MATNEEMSQALEKAVEPLLEEMRQIRRLLERSGQGSSGGGGSSGTPGIGLGKGRSSSFSASRSGSLLSGGMSRAGMQKQLSSGVSSALGGGVAGAIGGPIAAAIGGAAIDAVDYIRKPAWKAVKAAAVNYGADVLSGRVAPNREALGRNVGARLSEAFEDVPLVGGAYASANEPVRSAGERVKGITTQIARYGGSVTPELRRSLQARFEGEDRRAQAEAKEVDKQTRERLGSDDLQQLRSDQLVSVLTRLGDALGALVLNKNASGGVK